MALIQRLLKPIVDVRDNESVGVLLMFLYSFLAMTSYNILKPITRSKFISSLGSEYIPYVLLVSGVLIGIIMQGYSRGARLVPSKWVIPSAQGVMAALLVVFWFIFQSGAEWLSPLFYLLGQILGILLISQFWTLANEVYDARQAKRVFGFIGGGASLGGIAGSSILQAVQRLGTNNLLLVSAVLLGICVFLVVTIIRRAGVAELKGVTTTGEETEVKSSEGIKLLRENRHLQIIALVIMFAAIGAGLIEQQLNMAAEAFKGKENTDSLTQFLGQVQLYTSIAGFIIQIWLTSKIHRFLGIGFALLILPVSLGATAILMLLRGVIWAPMTARIVDTSLRYTVDKTTREILYLPLTTDVKQRAKPFVDVTVDRFGKAVSALLSLVLIADWGLNWDWQRLSIASLCITGLWVFTAIAAKRGYLRAFRNSIERRIVSPGDVRVNVGDLQTVETLIAELSDPDEQRVLYAIDVLEALDKRNLITPLLLYHESPKVRVRVLNTLGALPPQVADRWRPNIRKLLNDESPNVRAAAIVSLAKLGEATETDLARPYLDDPNPRVASTAAVVMAQSRRAADRAAAEKTLARLVDESDGPSGGRREVARALRQMTDPQFQSLLIPLLSDPNPSVAEEAMRSVQAAGTDNVLFVPALISLLRNRRLKSSARDVLVSYGEPVIDTLAFFLNDQEEEIWVRRHIPATLARIPSQKSMDVLLRALDTERDGFTRYKLVTAIDRLRREHPELTFDKRPFESMVLREGNRYFEYLSLHYNLFGKSHLPGDRLLAHALTEKIARAKNRVYLLLGLIYPWKDIVAARWAIEQGDARAKSSALEYLDNVLEGQVRRRLMPILDEMPIEERVRRGNVLLKTRERDVEESLLRLINDEDEVVSATAIDLVGREKITALADDVEHVLAHRDVHDWWVFEAASWTLAGFRVEKDRRRALWLEPLPAVEVVSRLRGIPIFRNVTIDELFRLVRAGRQVRHEAGRAIYQEGMAPSDLQLLLDGRVLLTSGTNEERRIDAPAPLGVEEALEGRTLRETVRAVDGGVVTLSLTLEEARTLLADNTDLVQGLFRWALDHPAFRTERVVMTGEEVPVPAAQPPSGALRPIDKVLMLQRLRLLARMPVDERMSLAAIATEVPLEPGTALFDEADPPALHTLIDGKVTLAATDGLGAVHADSGDAIGLFETLAGVPMGRRARVTAPGRALRISHDDLFDLLGQRPALLQHLFTALFGQRRA